MKQRYTAQQVIDALTATRGLVTLAAKRLGCDTDTIRNYAKRYPSVAKVKAEAREEVLDIAEAQLFLKIQQGDPWAIGLYLRTVGRSRGYGESLNLHVEITRVAAKVAQETGLEAEAI